MHGALQTPARERNILGATLISISYVLSRPRVSFYCREKASRVPQSMVNSILPLCRTQLGQSCLHASAQGFQLETRGDMAVGLLIHIKGGSAANTQEHLCDL
jgi:hypothetical protein